MSARCPICGDLGILTERTRRGILLAPCWACTPQPIAA